MLRVLDRATSRLPRRWRTTVDWLVTIAAAIVVVLSFEAEVAKPYRIPTASMEPTLHCARPTDGCEAQFSDRVIACEICYRFSSPERGQVVVFHAPAQAATSCDGGGVFVKRLIGLPRETVHEDEHANIWIDGRKLVEPYISSSVRATDTKFRGETWHVPPDSYLMLGDNRGNSCDSRVWGAVPRSSLIGPVVATYWPPTRLSFDA
jgi:signal peptidase I